MSPPERPSASSLHELLDVDRELSPEEMALLTQVAIREWAEMSLEAMDQARAAYAVANPEDFRTCVSQHLSLAGRRDMVRAEAYNCPACGRLLKDRRTPVASAVIQERGRLRQLYRAIFDAGGQAERERAEERFLFALGSGNEHLGWGNEHD